MEPKEQLTTKEAFEQLTSKRGWYNELDMTANTGISMMLRYRQGKITIDKMEEVLEKAGFMVVQEKLWSKQV